MSGGIGNASQPVAGSAQAALIATVSSNILLFSGLVIAGAMTLIASDAFKDVDSLSRLWAGSVLTLSLSTGVLAILSMMYAHNLLRRAERYQSGEETDLSRVVVARKTAVVFALLAFWVTIASAIVMVGFVMFVLLRSNHQTAKSFGHDGMSVSTVTYKSGRYSIEVAHLSDGCHVLIDEGGEARVSCAPKVAETTERAVPKLK